MGEGARDKISIRAEAFWLPGIFLFLLGLGNLLVGSLKTQQFEEILSELETTEQFKVEVGSTPLMRLQMARNFASNTPTGRRSHFEERRNFYRTVAFGGKVVMAVSLLLFALSAFFMWRHGGVKGRILRRVIRFVRG